MNKSLLLIICDFLLISILALVEFKPEVDVTVVSEQELRDQAAEEMLELLQLSLEYENSQREEVEDLLGKSKETLSQTVQSLQATESSLSKVSENLEQTKEEKEALANSLLDTRKSLDDTNESLSDTLQSLEMTLEQKRALASSLEKNQLQSQRLQEELQREQAQTEAKAAELEAAQETLQKTESARQQMATEMRILDTEKQMLAQNLLTAQAEVERSRIDAERAMTRTEDLAAGVSELAASSTALKEEIRQTQPLSLNTIYQRFEENRIFIRFEWEEASLFTSVKRESALQSLMIDTGSGVYAIFATGNTPLQESGKPSPTVTMTIGERSFRVQSIGFLEGEPGIACVRVSEEIVATSGLSPFTVSEDPLRFSNAVLVSDNEEVYGEIPIRVPPGEKGYLEIETKLFNRLFGEFSPGPGDYVFSMTGELTGIMVRSNRARIISSPQFGNYRSMAR